MIHIPHYVTRTAGPFAFGAMAGVFIGFGGRIGKIRNDRVFFIVGLAVGFVLSYASWVSWIYSSATTSHIFVLSPLAIVDIMSGLAGEGTFTFFEKTPTGVSLYAIWVIEAVIIVGSTAGVAVSMNSSRLFCEACNKWISKKESIYPLQPFSDPQELVPILERGDFAFLQTIEKLADDAEAYTQLDMHCCPRCDESNYLTVQDVAVFRQKPKSKKTTKKLTPIVTRLVISPEQRDTLRSLW